MLMTDADQDDSESTNKVTLMTIHSAKGLEYKYVYIVGVEDGIFPSRQMIDSMEALEEERRLFYVALTRAKVAATISHVEMRYNFQSKEFDLSHPSRFISEIDPQYLENVVDEDDERPQARPAGASAIDELRRKFDYRFQRQQQAPRPDDRGYGSGPAQRYARGSRLDRPQNTYSSVGGYGAGGFSHNETRFGAGAGSHAAGTKAAPDPALVQLPRPSTEGMRRVSVRPAAESAASDGPTAVGGYAVGQRVEHQKFGVGIIRRIEVLQGDHKLVIAFDNAGEKTLLAKFAKLTTL